MAFSGGGGPARAGHSTCAGSPARLAKTWMAYSILMTTKMATAAMITRITTSKVMLCWVWLWTFQHVPAHVPVGYLAASFEPPELYPAIFVQSNEDDVPLSMATAMLSIMLTPINATTSIITGFSIGLAARVRL